MELFLMVLFVSLLCLALTALAFSAATREDGTAGGATPARRAETPAPAVSRFFAESAGPTVALNGRAGLVAAPEALLLQIEQHIRLEHAAAEAFLERPTPQALHTRTTSPLLQ
jgi:hypothetical protein